MKNLYAGVILKLSFVAILCGCSSDTSQSQVTVSDTSQSQSPQTGNETSQSQLSQAEIETSHSQTPQTPDLIDFIDNTDKYVGRTLKMGLKISAGNYMKNGGLRDWRGQEVEFYAGTPKAQLTILILVPKDLDVPKANTYDSLDVTFVVNEGSLEKGNVALSITR